MALARGVCPICTRMTATLVFSAGTLELRGLQADGVELPPALDWDARTACYRAPALAYAEVVRALVHGKHPFDDQARAYVELEHGARVRREPRPYQSEGLAAWKKARGRGVVVLPTGAGKSHLAVMAIDDRRRSTLVVAPTLDLVRQWYDLLRGSFGTDVGLVGGGDHDVRPLTVTTYDSAYLHMEHLGARFGMVVFDECHHLPGATYALSAQLCLAPYRLGLTATPERADGREDALEGLIGPVVYRKDILELSGRYLAEYDTVRIEVELTPEAREEHDAERALYLDFVRSNGIRMGTPGGWTEFIQRSAGSEQGQRAMRAYRRQRELAFAAPAKLDVLDQLLHEHRGERTLVFTQDNATAYRNLAPLPRARHHAPDESARAKQPPRALFQRRVRRGRHLQGAERGCGRAGGQRGRGHQRQRQRARARAAAGAHPAPQRRQARRPVRARHGRHQRDLHQRAAAGARCVSLADARGAALPLGPAVTTAHAVPGFPTGRSEARKVFWVEHCGGRRG